MFRRPSLLGGGGGASGGGPTGAGGATSPVLKYGDDGNVAGAAAAGKMPPRKGSFTMLARSASDLLSSLAGAAAGGGGGSGGGVAGGKEDHRALGMGGGASTATATTPTQPRKEEDERVPLGWVDDDFPAWGFPPPQQAKQPTEAPVDLALKRADLERRVGVFLEKHDGAGGGALAEERALKIRRIVRWAEAHGEVSVNAKLFARFAEGLSVPKKTQANAARARARTNSNANVDERANETLRKQLVTFFEQHAPGEYAARGNALVSDALETAGIKGMDALNKELKKKFGATLAFIVASPPTSPHARPASPPPPPPPLDVDLNSPPGLGKQGRQGSVLELVGGASNSGPDFADLFAPPLSPINSKSGELGVDVPCKSYRERDPVSKSFGVCECGFSRADHRGVPSLFVVGAEWATLTNPLHANGGGGGGGGKRVVDIVV